MNRTRPAFRSTFGVRSFIGGAARASQVFGLSLALWIFTPVSEWLAHPLFVPNLLHDRADAIIVMEAWADYTGELNESGLKRTLAAADLHRSGMAPVVVLTGKAPTADRPGALEPMARLLKQQGLTNHQLILEGASVDTHESAVHVAGLARDRGWNRVVLVTDAGHMIRARDALRRGGLDVDCFSTMLWELGAAQPSWRLRRAAVLFHEYGGLVYYRWNGWI